MGRALIQLQHVLSTQTSNEGADLCAQQCNLGMLLLEKHQRGPWGQALSSGAG